MTINFPRTLNLTNAKNNFAFIVLFLFLLPNDYKHLISGFGPFLSIFVIFYNSIYILFNFNKVLSFFYKRAYFIVPFIISLISSIIYSNNIIGALYTLLQIITIMIVVMKFFECTNEYLILLEKIVFLILIITCMYIYIYKQPMSYSESGGRIYFIFEGEISKTMLGSMLLFSVIDKKHKLYKFLHIVLYILLYFFVLQSGVSSTIGITLFIICILLEKFKETKYFFGYKFFLILFTCSYLIIVSGLANNIISSIFNKSNTLSGRTEIWESMFTVIKAHPLLGVGEMSGKQVLSLTHILGATHAHNQFIQILVNSGILGLSAYIIIFMKFIKIKKKLMFNKFFRHFVLYLFCVLIMSITRNSFDNLFYFFILVVLNNLE